MYQSSGILKYSTEPTMKVVLEVDREIVRLYKWFAPKWVGLRSQMFDPHISIVRKEIPTNIDKFGLHEGREVQFTYDPVIYYCPKYWWIEVSSPELEDIRLELGLRRFRSHFSPDIRGFFGFHITIGNTKY